MDKNGVAARSWAGLGFGFAELGTVTALGQPGNERPRLFRLPQSAALINRMGFNNEGAGTLAARLGAAGIRRGNGAAGIPLGISIGKTKITRIEDAVEDYLTSFAALAPYADYLAVNVLQPEHAGAAPAAGRRAAPRAGRQPGPGRPVGWPADPVPIFVKIAPDLGEAALEELLDVCRAAGVSGLIAEQHDAAPQRRVVRRVQPGEGGRGTVRGATDRAGPPGRPVPARAHRPADHRVSAAS